ncbi:MAG: hypothetical protein LBE38_03090 [Deltaproteobacteria bacterium]|jgi:hypothetical protein|nr:hypothetical protein [Deltaproteobacteria bacterium]
MPLNREGHRGVYRQTTRVTGSSPHEVKEAIVLGESLGRAWGEPGESLGRAEP